MKKVLLLLCFVLLAGVLSFADDLGEESPGYYVENELTPDFVWPMLHLSTKMSVTNEAGEDCWLERNTGTGVIFEKGQTYSVQVEYANPEDTTFHGRIALHVYDTGYHNILLTLYEEEVTIEGHRRKKVSVSVPYDKLKGLEAPKEYILQFVYYEPKYEDYDPWVVPGGIRGLTCDIFVGMDNYHERYRDLYDSMRKAKEKIEADKRKKAEMEQIKETSSISLPQDYDPGRAIYYNVCEEPVADDYIAFFPHYHQIKILT